MLDNSVALAWCFEDEQTPAVLALLDQVAETGALAPGIWPLEAVNGLLVAERRERLHSDRRQQLLGFLQALPIAIDADTVAQTWNATMHIAERFRLSSYDAAYLELAQRLGLPLASLDRDLRAAASALEIVVLGTEP